VSWPFNTLEVFFLEFFRKFACQPSALIRVGNQKGAKKGNQSIGNLHLESHFQDEESNRLAWMHTGLDHIRLSFPSDSAQKFRKYLPSNCIMLEDATMQKNVTN
jgi:hypothetical protein